MVTLKLLQTLIAKRMIPSHFYLVTYYHMSSPFIIAEDSWYFNQKNCSKDKVACYIESLQI